MYMRSSVPKKYSIAEARGQLPRLLYAVEAGEQIEITRRGKPVAVVLSIEDYKRLTGPTRSFAEAYEAWQATVTDADRELPAEYWDELRDRSEGREVEL
jgi:prevent-host-death family protein